MDFLFESNVSGEEEKKLLSYTNLSVQWKVTIPEDTLKRSKVIVSADKYSHIITSGLLKTPSQPLSSVGSIIGKRVVTDSVKVEEVGSGEGIKYGQVFASNDQLVLVVQFQRSFNNQERILSCIKQLFPSLEQEFLLLISESVHGVESSSIRQLTTSSASSTASLHQVFQTVPLLPVGKIISQFAVASFLNYATVRRYPLTLLSNTIDTDDKVGVFRNYHTILQNIKEWLQIEDLLVDVQSDEELSRQLQAIILAEENSLYL